MKYLILIFTTVFLSLSSPADGVREIKEDFLTIEFEEGLEGAAKDVLSLVPQLKKDLEERTGLPFELPFTLLLVRERAEFIRMVGSDLVSAIAVPARGLIVVDLSRMAVHPLNLELMIKHEMCHLLLHENIHAGSFPRWFDEGVCQWVSDGMNEVVSPDAGNVLRRAAVGGRLIPFHTLSVTFPADGTMFTLAYEQSLDMIEFLSQKHGKAVVRDILTLLQQGGKTFPEAVREETGASFGALEKEWREGLLLKYTWLSYVLDNFVWMIFVAGALLTACGFRMYRKRMKEYPEDDENEEDDDHSPSR